MNSSRKWPFVLMAVGSLAFIVLMFSAMLLYRGGIYIDPNTKGYSFLDNSFSDLGRYQYYNGQPNILCRAIFSGTMIATALVFIPFFLAWRRIFTPRTFAGVLATIGCCAGIVSAGGYIAVGLTPWDRFFVPHSIAVYTGFLGMVAAAGLFSLAMFGQKGYSKAAAGVMCALCASALLYVGLMFLGPSYKTAIGLRIQVVGQKIIVFAQIAVLFYEAIAALAYQGHQHGKAP